MDLETGPRKYRDGSWLRKKYVEERMSSEQIADVCGVHGATILDNLVTLCRDCHRKAEPPSEVYV